MCGIFGYSFAPGSVSAVKRGILATTLARLNDDRGGHSYGIVGVVNGMTDIHRGLGDLYPNSADVADYETVWCHTRWATTGAHTVENAHPFEIGRILGAHNGIVYNHGTLSERYSRDFNVDSMHLFAHLSDDLDFGDISGYGAIEWMDTDRAGKIFLSRLDGGELCVCGIGPDPDNCVGVVWSSDDKHLHEALTVAGVEYFEFEIQTSQVYYVSGHQLYRDGERCLELSDDIGGYHEKLPSWYEEWKDEQRARAIAESVNALCASDDAPSDDPAYAELDGERPSYAEDSDDASGLYLNRELDPWEEYQTGAEANTNGSLAERYQRALRRKQLPTFSDSEDWDTADDIALKEWLKSRASSG